MPGTLGLFEGYGVEMEYMIVDRETLGVLPISDRILEAKGGELASEGEAGPLCWSNELVLHVIELKTNGPVAALDGVAETFSEHLRQINALLRPLGGQLMPTAMHPWMDPFRETRLWPHDNREIYDTYNRIFGCSGHGWSNLQSVHLNLPFGNDEEFGRLHAAIRLVLPLLPALAASSPFMDGRLTGYLDNRLEVYRLNQRLVPSVTGRVIPEPVFTRRAYEREILNRMYKDIEANDPEGILRYEWLNSRGAIARFDRGAIEIRILDIQECPQADFAVLGLTSAILKALVAETWCSFAQQKAWQVDALAPILLHTIRDGEQALIDDTRYLDLFGVSSSGRCTAGELLSSLSERTLPVERMDDSTGAALQRILREGPLARRISRAVGENPAPEGIMEVYRELCLCLAEGRTFHV